MVNASLSEAKRWRCNTGRFSPSWLTHENANIPSLIIIPSVDLISQASALNPGWEGSRSSAVSQHLFFFFFFKQRASGRNNPALSLWRLRTGRLGIRADLCLQAHTHALMRRLVSKCFGTNPWREAQFAHVKEKEENKCTCLSSRKMRGNYFQFLYHFTFTQSSAETVQLNPSLNLSYEPSHKVIHCVRSAHVNAS